jgi:STE24 endopeptidase
VDPTTLRARRLHGSLGLWRALLAVPSMAGGAGVILVGLGFLGPWEGCVVLIWLWCGPLILTRAGERVALRIGYRCRPPSEADRRLMDRVWQQVLARCGVSSKSVDLYLQRADTINAYAIGRRSVAVTSRVLAAYQSGLLDVELLAGVLAHELGHQATRAGQFGPAVAWYVLPWRLFSRAVLRLCFRLAPGQPRALVAVVVVAGFAVAIVQECRAGMWAGVVTLVVLMIGVTTVPLADAAVSRASERAADRFAARAGYAEALARVLTVLELGPAQPRGFLERMLARHPDSAQRVVDLRVADMTLAPSSPQT